MARQDEVEMLRVVDGVEHGQNGPSRVAKDLLDIVSEHHFMEDLAPRETDE